MIELLFFHPMTFVFAIMTIIMMKMIKFLNLNFTHHGTKALKAKFNKALLYIV